MPTETPTLENGATVSEQFDFVKRHTRARHWSVIDPASTEMTKGVTISGDRAVIFHTVVYGRPEEQGAVRMVELSWDAEKLKFVEPVVRTMAAAPSAPSAPSTTGAPSADQTAPRRPSGGAPSTTGADSGHLAPNLGANPPAPKVRFSKVNPHLAVASTQYHILHPDGHVVASCDNERDAKRVYRALGDYKLRCLRYRGYRLGYDYGPSTLEIGLCWVAHREGENK